MEVRSGGYYILEYCFRDTRGHLITRRLMRGTFELVIPIYKELARKHKNKDVHRPVLRPRLVKVTSTGDEIDINYKEELESWQNKKIKKT